MRCNWREGRPGVYLDETLANADEGKSRAYLEKDPVTNKGIVGEVQGFGTTLYLLIIVFCVGEIKGKKYFFHIVHLSACFKSWKCAVRYSSAVTSLMYGIPRMVTCRYLHVTFKNFPVEILIFTRRGVA